MSLNLSGSSDDIMRHILTMYHVPDRVVAKYYHCNTGKVRCGGFVCLCLFGLVGFAALGSRPAVLHAMSVHLRGSPSKDWIVTPPLPTQGQDMYFSKGHTII